MGGEKRLRGQRLRKLVERKQNWFSRGTHSNLRITRILKSLSALGLQHEAHAVEVGSPGDVIVVWHLDRLGRSVRDLINLVGQFESKEIGLKSLQEAIDTTTSGGKLIFHIFGALAEFERNLIRERTHERLAAARSRDRKGRAT